MAQGTVKHFDTDTATGTVLLDDETEVVIDAETFAASGLEELRIGQRVRMQLDGSERDTDDTPMRATRVSLISI